jgi:hypothetical protein
MIETVYNITRGDIMNYRDEIIVTRKSATEKMEHKIDVSKKLADLAKRADKVKIDPNLRHMPNEHDIQVVSQNTQLAQYHQYQTMDNEEAM